MGGLEQRIHIPCAGLNDWPFVGNDASCSWIYAYPQVSKSLKDTVAPLNLNGHYSKASLPVINHRPTNLLNEFGVTQT